MDLAAGPKPEFYNMTALTSVVTETGRRFTSLDGEPDPFGGNTVATSPLLHDVILHHLSAETDRVGPGLSRRSLLLGISVP